jgi:meso-butanediol dehydrogenase/(S,S)-butanediol dehydrogenase/diacetyl reductase
VGKVIVITGAGSGLGRNVAKRLASDGDTVILLGRTLSKIEDAAKEAGSTAVAIQCDITSPDSVRAAFARIAALHPRIDVLINNAGVYQPLILKEATDEQIHDHVMTNLAGTIYCSRAAIPMMERGGHIINVGSESVDMPFPMFTMYRSTKAGMEKFSETLHDELKPDGIRVTVIRCGAMMGEHVSVGWAADPAIAGRFHQACLKAGIDLANDPISNFASVASVFRSVIDLPSDVNIPHVTLEGFRAVA